LLKTEEAGRAYYVNPDDKSLTYMADASGAFNVMRQASLGIASSSLRSIPEAKIVLDNSGKEVSRTWQSLGWWGIVNENRIPAMSDAKSDADRLGWLYKSNTVKVLSIKKGAGVTWYQIDGGKYPGAYIEARFVKPISQPLLADALSVPDKVKSGEYWVDVDITKKVLYLYNGSQAMMATYISSGAKETPTIIGTYNVWLKLKKTRMTGRPPIATHEYDLPNVPWVMYYKGSYSIHGTYWHDDFGTERSSGCTNVTQGDSKFIFDITGPEIGEADSIRPSATNPGLLIRNHR
jgi:hypothetical protein